MVGTSIAHYHIAEFLGKGGMGEVYAAEDTRLGRRVALKVLSRELAMDADRRERFEREARAVAALNHPNIVTIYSVEEAGGVPFLTLELVEGRTLDALIPPGGLPVDRILAYAIPLADAVGAAHQRGVTHRDLKPGNVMIGDDGRVKVLDFGLAKLKESNASLAASLPTQELTGEGRIVGTVAYMSPEQAEGKLVDPRSDVFSLGVVIFEMATSQRPFKGDTQVSLLSSIIKDTPSSLTDLKADLPRDLARIVRRCLSKDPEDRYQTAKDLRNDLRALKEDLSSGAVAAAGSDVHAVPAARGAAAKRPFARVVVAGIAILSAAAAAFVYWSGGGGQPGVVSTANAQPFASVSLTRLTTTGAAGLAAISDDGRYVAYAVTEGGKSGLWLRQVATTSNVAIVPPSEVRLRAVTFSPDGNYVYYSFYPEGEQRGSLWQVPVLGGVARRVLDDVDGEISFDPSGKRFAMVRGIARTQEAALIVVDTNGFQTKTLVTRKAPNRLKFQSVAWSPDGRSIAALAERGEDLEVDVLLIDALTGRETVLGNHAWRDATYVQWLPDGKSLLVNAQEANGEAINQVWLVSTSGQPRRITNDLSTYAGISLTADGKSFVSVRRERSSRVWIVDAPGAEPRVVSSGAGAEDGVNGLAWTADGRLVYTSASAGNLDIWLMDADGRNRVPLTSDKAHDSWPAVTPDGRRIVFVSERGGARGLWVMRTDGSEQRRIGSVTVNAQPGLSADDTWVYFTAPGGRNFRIGIDGGEPVPLEVSAPAGGAAGPLPEAFHEPVSSPDGRMIAGHYNSSEVKAERIAVVPLDGGAPRLFSNVTIPAEWSSDAKSLLYLVTRDGGMNLWRQPIAGGPAVALTRFPDERIFRFSASRDQKRWAIVRGTIASDVVLVSERD